MKNDKGLPMLRFFAPRSMTALAFVLLTCIHPRAGHADDATHCKNPDWAPTPMSGFAIDSCEHKDWSSLDVDLPADTKTLQGKFSSVYYTLPKDSGPSAEYVKQYQIKAAEATGAKLESDPAAPFQAVLRRKTAQGEFWFIYDHGSGNDESTTSYTLTTIETAPPAQYVVARQPAAPLDTQGKVCADPPWLVKQYPWYKLHDCTVRDFDAIKLDLPDGEKTLAGRMLDVNYALTDDSKDQTARAVRDNYIRALQKIGAKLVSDPENEFQAVLMQKAAQGTLWYIYNHGTGNGDSTASYILTTLQVGAPPPKACTLEVYGVHFDTDKATLRPDATPVLEQVFAMLQQDAAATFEIGGHTDDIGNDAHNLSLSKARAKAVVDWLVAQGITASRLTAQGYGESKPLAPNDSDAHRAKNRRVELKNRHCRAQAAR